MAFDHSTLLGKALNAFKWNALGIILRIVLQFSVMVAMARLVGPDDFGFFAGCLLVFGLSALLADLGLSMALVQRQDLTEDTRSKAWGALMASHALVATCIFAGAPVIANIVGDNGLQDGIRSMAAALLTTCFLAMPMVELRRRLDFRQIQQVQLGGYCAGYVLTGIPLAFLGWGGWSLIMAHLVQQAVMAGISIRAVARIPAPNWGGLPPGVSAFGVRAIGSNLANWVTENLDNLIVSHFKGLTALGAYSVAYNLARTPTNHVVNLVQQVVFAASSRAQEDEDALAKGYLALLRAVTLVTLPLFWGAALVADSVIVGLYGERWAAAGGAFAALCVAMPWHAVMALAGPILAGRGQAGVEFKVQLSVAATLGIALLILIEYPLPVIAWAVCAVYALRAVWMTLAVANNLAVSAARLFSALTGPLVLAMASMILLGITDAFLANTSLGAEGKLAVLMTSAAIAPLTAIVLFPAEILGKELAFLGGRLPFLRQRMLARDAGI